MFVAVAQHLSFTRAADALGVTASAASLQVRSLEDYLSRSLFRRNGRQVVLTADGEKLLPRVQQALEQLEHAIDGLRHERHAGPVRITTLMSFQQQWLLPRIPRFNALHPDIDLHLHTSNELVDFVRQDFHVGIRLGVGSYPNLRSERLLQEWLLPVCTPALLRQHGPLGEPRDIARYPLLHSVGEPWSDWLLEGESTGPERRRGAVLDGSSSVVRMAVQGAGLALARWSLVADEIAAGQLVAASSRALPYRHSYWLAYPPRVGEMPAARLFLDWLRAEAASFPAPAAVIESK